MEVEKIDEYFTRKSSDMAISDFVKFQQASDSSPYKYILWIKNHHYSWVEISLKEEDKKWKIDKVYGQTDREMDENIVNVRVETTEFKKKIIKLEKPNYPPAAKAVCAFGEVLVEIIVDENGNVTFAKAIKGHPLLRKASEQAALKSTFSPIIIDGNAVKANGIMIYDFHGWW